MLMHQPNFYITVATEQPGEYLLNVVGHEEGLRGVLDHGSTEAGFIKAEEISNYLYLFEVFEDQNISFEV